MPPDFHLKGGLCWIHWWSVEKELPVANWLLLETVGAGVCRSDDE